MHPNKQCYLISMENEIPLSWDWPMGTLHFWFIAEARSRSRDLHPIDLCALTDRQPLTL